MHTLEIPESAFADKTRAVEVFTKDGRHWGTADGPGEIVSTNELEFRLVDRPVEPKPPERSEYERLSLAQKVEAIRGLAGITTDQVVKEVNK